MGDVVSVHYLCRSAEAAEPERLLDDSRSRGEAMSFVLGRGEVIDGWEALPSPKRLVSSWFMQHYGSRLPQQKK